MKRILIIGGAGFIGSNATRHFIKKGWEVTILDDLSRKGTDFNLKQLKREYPKGIRFVRADITTDTAALNKEVSKHDAILHLAAQVAVTTSLVDPRRDFEINALGTFNVLEAVRCAKNKPVIIYSSTNKVYGSLPQYTVQEKKDRFVFKEKNVHTWGVSEKEHLDFHSPYGCSKGSADQYVLDYARIYGVRSVVFRQSCIYGDHQMGIEDQGWVAWFIIAATLERPITIYGTGKQVRDVLHVEDLVDAYERAITRIDKVAGEVFNMGGGPKNTASLKEFLALLQNKYGFNISPKTAKERAGDQPVYISDIRKAERLLGWKPKISFEKGVARLVTWVANHKDLFTKHLA